MMNRLAKLAAVALVAAAVAPLTADAHGFWFAQRSKQMAMVFGIGADDLDMVQRLPKVTKFAAFDASGHEVASKLTVSGPIVLVDMANKPAFLTGVMNYGLWTKTPDGEWYNKGKDEVPNAIVAEQNYKYGVRIMGPLSGPMPLFPGQRLQIVPVDNSLPDKMGTPIKLRVLFNGKPAKGARVMRDWLNDPDDKGIATGDDGTVTIPVRNQGLNVITAVFNTPPDDPKKTNTDEHLATLSFVLPHEPE